MLTLNFDWTLPSSPAVTTLHPPALCCTAPPCDGWMLFAGVVCSNGSLSRLSKVDVNIWPIRESPLGSQQRPLPTESGELPCSLLQYTTYTGENLYSAVLSGGRIRSQEILQLIFFWEKHFKLENHHHDDFNKESFLFISLTLLTAPLRRFLNIAARPAPLPLRDLNFNNFI